MSNKLDKRFINLAEQVARLGGDMRYKLAAIITYKKTILAIGNNRWTGLEPFNTVSGPIYSFHAEMDALRKVLKVYPEFAQPENYGKLTLYVARKHFRMAKPCDKCEITLKKSPIGEIVYSHSPGNVGKLYV